MKPYELAIIMDSLNYSVRNDWEMTRSLMLAIASPFSKKQLKATDIMKLPWDDKTNKSKSKTEVTKEIVQQMQKTAEDRKAALVAAGII